MILWYFRKHLADELRNFPEEHSAATQSYAVVTATLARTMLAYLNANDLTIPNGFRTECPEYELLTVLNRIIHFRTLGQDAISYDFPGEPDLITVYSDKSLPHEDHMYIRLTDYRNVMNRLAADDLFVAPYLLKRAITEMHHLMAKPINKEIVSGPREVAELRRLNTGLILNSWDMVLNLQRAAKVEVHPSPIICYEGLYRRQGGRIYEGYRTTQELVDGYGKAWIWEAFNPSLYEIAGCATYCMPLHEIERKENGTIRGLDIPFNALIDLFKDVHNQVTSG